MFSSNQKLLSALWLSNNISPVLPAYEEKHDPLQLIYWLKLVIFSGNTFLKLCPAGQKEPQKPFLSGGSFILTEMLEHISFCHSSGPQKNFQIQYCFFYFFRLNITNCLPSPLC